MNNSSPKRSVKSFTLNKQTLMRAFARLRRFTKRLPKVIFLQHNRMTEVIILSLFALVSIWIVVSFLFMTPARDVIIKRQVELAVPTVDTLELWLEQRQTAYENPPAFSAEVWRSK